MSGPRPRGTGSCQGSGNRGHRQPQEGLGMGMGLVHLTLASRSGLALLWESPKRWQGAGEAMGHPKAKRGR